MSDQYRIEPAKTNRSTCKASKEKIEKGELRFGSNVDVFGDGGSYQWRKLEYLTDRIIQNVENKVGSIEHVSGWDDLSEDQQETFQKAFEAARKGPKPASAKAKAKPKLDAVAKAPPEKSVTKTPPTEKEQHAFLDYAKSCDDANIRRLVEENPLYVDVQPCGRWSALHQFALNGDVDMVRFLLENGASRDVVTKDGQTPFNVAKKVAVKQLLTTSLPKRKAASDGGPAAKRCAVGEGKIVLHLFEPLSATDLAAEFDWEIEEESFCNDDVQHADMETASAAAREVACRLRDALKEAELSIGEGDCTPKVVIISNPGKDAQEACFKALAVRNDFKNISVKECAQLMLLDFADRLDTGGFCYAEEDSERDYDEEVKAATRVMVETLKTHFEFSFDQENLPVVPVIWGGFTGDGSIVGVLGTSIMT
eukprot:TRINITY_DN27906_c0_g1_i1.p1 TRINITY_DN27906_c0_g1~~TRINITY_DN27906_c0_g1_i1.p1  ORF type:complete len:424 (+),score=108.37 TRINITY_DN27906_c0_g1_i1:68-1339(+)